MTRWERLNWFFVGGTAVTKREVPSMGPSRASLNEALSDGDTDPTAVAAVRPV